MPNGGCRFHGGKSTGPKTPEGAERARQAALRHGFYTAEAKASGNGRVLLSLACERFWLGARPVTWAATKGIYPGSRIHCYPDGGER